MVLAWIAGWTECLQQKCESIGVVYNSINTYGGPKKSYYFCQIFGQLKNDQEVVTTDTSENKKSNKEVTMVVYESDHIVKFIPNSLFETFINLEYLSINTGNKFETMKREYLRNATKLKSLNIFRNSLQTIEGNVFSEAKTLEHINFESNQIESIHKAAFNGLPNLKGVYLYDNKIKNLHPQTFSSIANLIILELSGGKNCVNEEFTSANQKFPEIEGKISSGCTYEPFPDEMIVKDEELRLARIQIQEANDKISNLTAEAQANQVKNKNLTNKLKEIKAELSSQEKKHVKELADQKKESDDKIADQQKELTKIAGEKLQMEARITHLEAKLYQQMEPQECKSELQLEFINHKNQIDAKLTAQKLELLQECKSEAFQEIAKHNIEGAKLSGQMIALQNIYLGLVDRIKNHETNTNYIAKIFENNILDLKKRLNILEKKDD